MRFGLGRTGGPLHRRGGIARSVPRISALTPVRQPPNEFHAGQRAVAGHAGEDNQPVIALQPPLHTLSTAAVRRIAERNTAEAWRAALRLQDAPNIEYFAHGVRQ